MPVYLALQLSSNSFFAELFKKPKIFLVLILTMMNLTSMIKKRRNMKKMRIIKKRMKTEGANFLPFVAFL